MTVVVAILCGAGAAVWWRLAVPRARIRHASPGEAPPDLRALATTRRALVLAVGVSIAAQVLNVVDHSHWWVWIPYLVLGAPLILVDALTTWLPLDLHRWCAGSMVLGLVVLAVASPRAAVTALLAGVLVRIFFWVVWRTGSGFGFGDVRLAGLAGAAAGTLGLESALVAVFAATLIGAAVAVFHALRRHRAGAPAHFPYGPALWLAPFVAALWPG